VDWSSSIRHRAAVIRRLRPADIPGTFAATALLWVALMSMRRGGFRTATSRVEALCPTRQPRRGGEDRPARIAREVRLVGIAAELVPSYANCLPRSLVVKARLCHLGVPADLRIGVSVADSGLQAHAWVEVDGDPVNDSRGVVEQFSPFDAAITPAIVAAME
jgi:hypothetical protein